jgi:glutathione S-transferase
VLLNIDKPFAMLASKTWGMPSTPEVEAGAKEALGKALPIIEGRLASSPYLAGASFSVADIVARSSFKYAESAEFDLSAYPAIVAWMAHCAERPAYIKAQASG